MHKLASINFLPSTLPYLLSTLDACKVSLFLTSINRNTMELDPKSLNAMLQIEISTKMGTRRRIPSSGGDHT